MGDQEHRYNYKGVEQELSKFFTDSKKFRDSTK